MFISNTLSRSPVSDPAKDNRTDYRKYLIKLDNSRHIWKCLRFLRLNHEVEAQEQLVEKKHVRLQGEN